MLVDDITLTVSGGNGGNGAISFLRDAKGSKGGPNGGNGGNGGSVYVIGSTNLVDLRDLRFTKKVKAENGQNGLSSNKYGKNAPHKTLVVPLGTRITDCIAGGYLEITATDKEKLLALGGIGGKGNTAFKSSTVQAPRYAQKGTAGEIRTLRFELRYSARIGLVGYPSAGKSSLLAKLTNATPTIGNYPFTTVQPTIGMLDTYPIADIPGLIDGASTGKGLGIKFLKHIEKTKILIHVVDCSLPQPIATYNAVRNEFDAYGNGLSDKPEIIFLNKTDLVDAKKLKELRKQFAKLGKPVYSGSTFDEKSMEELKNMLLTLLKE